MARLEPRPFVTVVAEILYAAATVVAWTIETRTIETRTIETRTIETLAFEAAAVAFAEPMPALKARMMRPQHASQHRKAALLRVVEALIKRGASVGDLLQRGA